MNDVVAWPVVGIMVLAFLTSLVMTKRCPKCGLFAQVRSILNQKQTVYIGYTCEDCGSFRAYGEKTWHDSFLNHQAYLS